MVSRACLGGPLGPTLPFPGQQAGRGEAGLMRLHGAWPPSGSVLSPRVVAGQFLRMPVKGWAQVGHLDAGHLSPLEQRPAGAGVAGWGLSEVLMAPAGTRGGRSGMDLSVGVGSHEPSLGISVSLSLKIGAQQTPGGGIPAGAPGQHLPGVVISDLKSRLERVPPATYRGRPSGRHLASCQQGTPSSLSGVLGELDVWAPLEPPTSSSL